MNTTRIFMPINTVMFKKFFLLSFGLNIPSVQNRMYVLKHICVCVCAWICCLYQ